MTGWVDDAIFWQLYPLGFVGAEIRPDRPVPADQRPTHRLPRIVDWLDYAVELGASGLLLGPIFAAQTHGYDTVDHFRIDPRLGDDADFDELVGQCRRRGLRVVLDGVFNHVGRGHPAFAEVLARGAGAPHADWFVADGSGADRGFATFEGHQGLVTLDHSSPAVAKLVTEVMTYWLARGADGWRLDAAYAVPARFWRGVIGAVRADFPDAYLFGEMIHGDYAGYVAESGLDSVTQYELWKAIWSSINDANLFELAWAVQRHAEFLESFVPQTFVGNHDVTRLASRLAEPAHLAHTVVVLATLGGTPSIYAGDEQSFRGVKYERVGGDDEVRPAFPDSPAELSPLGEPNFRLHQELLGLRRRHRWLHRARPEILHTANEQLVYRSGDPAASSTELVVALNIAAAPAAVPVPAGLRLIAGSGEIRGGPGTELTLPENGWAVLAPA
ncbi:alpha-amylase family protein [Nakamurella lactea]|uniref:alpha-amylase family protein n=1 Tax=Nakamurella lactea TaxID=459515 RepID=UPI00048E0909|nr:alpha-amylase family protein [Nakamurella lactea]